MHLGSTRNIFSRNILRHTRVPYYIGAPTRDALGFGNPILVRSSSFHFLYHYPPISLYNPSITPVHRWILVLGIGLRLRRRQGDQEVQHTCMPHQLCLGKLD